MLLDRQTQGNAQRYSFISETHKVVLGSRSTKNTITIRMLGSISQKENGAQGRRTAQGYRDHEVNTTKDRRKLRTKV